MNKEKKKQLLLEAMVQEAKEKEARIRRKQTVTMCKKLSKLCRSEAIEAKAAAYDAGMAMFEAAAWLDRAADIAANKKSTPTIHNKMVTANPRKVRR